MREVGTFEAKNRLSSLLDLVEAGEEITITRNGKPVARLVAAEGRDIEEARQAAAGLRAIREKARRGSEGLKDLINEGRRY
ncbi:type II toxin-antitoxin system Phd/YefM family antitoxin [Mesorhizobium sp. ASY16-5R]|uniref:type II toxin-antitoxin system Phd/YefM family antitoxin n=1 Tax=Mesorhizobium sp. ASY16-5R TaxID=3445772 RepID=UPI003F9F3758